MEDFELEDICFDDVLFPDSPRDQDFASCENSDDSEEFFSANENENEENENGVNILSSSCDNYFIDKDEEGDFSVSFKASEQLTKQTKKISLQNFEILRLVGKGAYGKVYQVRKKDSGQIFAMKVLKKELLIQTNNVSYTMTERNILRDIRHPFIASLYYAFQTKGKVYLVMEFLNGGQMLYHMRTHALFSEDYVRVYAAEIVLALEYLHSQDIIHRDIKPENVLLASDGHLSIADFGLAKVNAVDSSAKTFCGTVEYMAPEIIRGSGHGKAVDWWSLGILICDTLTGDPPFKAKQRNILQKNILKGKFKLPNYLTSSASSIIRALLKTDPTKRLGSSGAGKVKQHSFFKGIDWEKLYKKKIPPPFVPDIKNGLEDTSYFERRFLRAKLGDSSDEEEEKPEFVEEFLGFSYVRSSYESFPEYLRESENDNSL